MGSNNVLATVEIDDNDARLMPMVQAAAQEQHLQRRVDELRRDVARTQATMVDILNALHKPLRPERFRQPLDDADEHEVGQLCSKWSTDDMEQLIQTSALEIKRLEAQQLQHKQEQRKRSMALRLLRTEAKRQLLADKR